MNQTKEEKKHFTVNIIPEYCKACNYCVVSCKKNVFAQGDTLNTQGYAFIHALHTDDCIGCLTCIGVCPDFAITVKNRAV